MGVGKPSAATQKRMKDRLFRAVKRQLIDQGVIMDPSARPPKYQFTWAYGELTGECFADTRSEARAIIKRDLGIPKKQRLPSEVTINRYDNETYVQGMIQSHANLRQSDGQTAPSANVW